MNLKRDRRVKSNTKGKRCEIRMSDEELQILESMVNKTGLTKTEVIQKALKMYNNLVNVQFFDE